MPGIYIAKGTTLTISNLSIQFGENGEVSASPISLNVHFDVGPTWIQIAKRHLAIALESQVRRQAAWQGTDETKKGDSLEREFEASMQAIMAAAIAWDAVYAVLQGYVELPPALLEKWRSRRTARYSQVTEVVRRAFALKEKSAGILRQNLRELYRYRDLAVHPSGKKQAPINHPDLDVGVEWRFVYFRAENAELAVSVAAAMLWDLAANGSPKLAKVAEYQKGLIERLRQIYPDGPPIPKVSPGNGPTE